MDFALLLSTFVTVFLAELGDKTQLATVAISGTSDRPLAVFLGSSSALVLASLLGALAGGSVATVIPSDLLQLVAALGFLYSTFLTPSALLFKYSLWCVGRSSIHNRTRSFALSDFWHDFLEAT